MAALKRLWLTYKLKKTVNQKNSEQFITRPGLRALKTLIILIILWGEIQRAQNRAIFCTPTLNFSKIEKINQNKVSLKVILHKTTGEKRQFFRKEIIVLLHYESTFKLNAWIIETELSNILCQFLLFSLSLLVSRSVMLVNLAYS